VWKRIAGSATADGACAALYYRLSPALHLIVGDMAGFFYACLERCCIARFTIIAGYL
jgi:hypothetical protein